MGWRVMVARREWVIVSHNDRYTPFGCQCHGGGYRFRKLSGIWSKKSSSAVVERIEKQTLVAQFQELTKGGSVSAIDALVAIAKLPYQSVASLRKKGESTIQVGLLA